MLQARTWKLKSGQPIDRYRIIENTMNQQSTAVMGLWRNPSLGSACGTEDDGFRIAREGGRKRPDGRNPSYETRKTRRGFPAGHTS
jgi:hypothetical protein